jgi:hypothetical protein
VLVIAPVALGVVAYFVHRSRRAPRLRTATERA